MNQGLGRMKGILRLFVGFSLEEFAVSFYCFSTVGALFFGFFPDLNMNHLIQIHPNLASWNRAEKEPLNPPYSRFFSSLFPASAAG